MNHSRAHRLKVFLSLAIACLGGCTEDVRNGGEPNPCDGALHPHPIGWNESNLLEMSARQAFAGLAGSCTAVYEWSAEYAGLVPTAARGEMSVRVLIDEDSARLMLPPKSGVAARCAPQLEVDAELSVESADGVFADRGRGALRYNRNHGVENVVLEVALDQTGGSLEPGRAGTARGIRYTFDGAGATCAGTIGLIEEESGIPREYRHGSFSSTVCTLGQKVRSLDQLQVGDTSFASSFSASWGDLRLQGRWDNENTETVLHIEAELTSEIGCETSEAVLEVPVQVVYETTDRRLARRRTQGTAFLPAVEGPVRLRFEDEFDCTSYSCSRVSFIDQPDGRFRLSTVGGAATSQNVLSSP